MNAIIDQQQQEYEDDERQQMTIAITAGYVRKWFDVDGKEHYELTEKGIKRLATLMV